MGPCPPRTELVELRQGLLSSEAAAQLSTHLDACPVCQERYEMDAVTTASLAADTLNQAPGERHSAPGEHHALQLGSLVGRYLALEAIGKGGMGVVYAAYDPELNRRVAIKLLRPREGRPGAEDPIRMLREAQAMARLAHPNVVAVYDVGTVHDRVFIAMELVDGIDLKRWRHQQPGSQAWRAVLPVYLQAGHGLAAAHAAGLVHRDFKPANVLLGSDERVRVTDFGLARQAVDDEHDSAGAERPARSAHDSRDLLATPLTVAGRLHGTPGYMAPEQARGAEATAQSDQFSFCVALYEALHGQRPFMIPPGAYCPDSWDVPPAPKGSRVPTWLRRVLLRGLATDPGQRYPSMDALLTALQAGRRRAGRRWIYAGSVVLLSGIVGAFLASSPSTSPPLCRDSNDRLVGVWDAERKAGAEKAFRASGRPLAVDSWARVERALNAYGQSWTAMHTEACSATRVRGEQSDEVLTLRMSCLDRRLRDVNALVDLFVAADGTIIDEAMRAAGALVPVDECARIDTLRARVKPPEDPQVRVRVDAARDRVAQLKALHDARQYRRGLELASAVAAEATATGYRPLEAEAHELLGRLDVGNGKYAEAELALEHAFDAALAGGDDTAAASAAAALVRVTRTQNRHDDARAWAAHAKALLERVGGDEAIEADLEVAMAVGGRVDPRESRPAGERRELAPVRAAG